MRRRRSRAGGVLVALALLAGALATGLLARSAPAAAAPVASALGSPAMADATVPRRQPARSLRVVVSGLPAGVSARIRVVGPKRPGTGTRFRRTVTGTTLLTRLVRGVYRVSARPVAVADGSATASVSRTRLRVRAATRATVRVSYTVPAAPDLGPVPTTSPPAPEPDTVPSATPPQPALVTGTLVTGGYHSCGIDPSGAAWCWGSDSFGQVGDGDDGQADEFVPVQVAGGRTFTALAAGVTHTCALDTMGGAWCWGRDLNGQVGDGNDSQGDERAPVAVVTGRTFTALAAGGNHTCGLDPGGVAWCWGQDAAGQVGDGNDGQGSDYAPSAVVGGHTFTALATGGLHTCGTDATGATWCWGSDAYGQVGDGNDGQANEFGPVAVAGGRTFTALAAGFYHSCGTDAAGAAWCWGRDNDGQIGDGNDGQINKYTPVSVAGGHTLKTP